MTFEQKYKEILQNDLGAIFGFQTEYRKIVNVANDLSDNTLNHADSLLAVIRTGQGLRSSTPYLDNVSLPLTINFYFDRNFIQEFLSEISKYIKTKNAVGDGTEIDYETVYYKMNFTNPYVMDGAIDWVAKESRVSMQLAQVVLMAEIVYSTQIEYKHPEITFTHDNVDYEIKNLLRYSRIAETNHVPYQPSSFNTTIKEIIGYESSLSITITKTNDNPFTELILDNFVNPIDQTKPMSYTLDGKTCEIQKITVNESFDNGTSDLEIVFLR